MLFFNEVLFLNAVVSLILGVFVFVKNPSQKLNKLWLVVSMHMFFCFLGWGLTLSTTDLTYAYWYMKWINYNLGAIFIPASFLHFMSAVVGENKRLKKVIVFFYGLAVFFVIANCFDIFVKYRPKPPFFCYAEVTSLFCVFTLMYSVSAIYSFILLFSAFRRQTGIEKERIKYQLFAQVVLSASGTTIFFYIFNVNILPYGVYIFPLYCIIMSYAIYKYNLLDIKLVITRIGLFFILYLLILGIPFWLWKDPDLHLYAFLSLFVFASVGPFVYRFLYKQSDKLNVLMIKAFTHDIKNKLAAVEMSTTMYKKSNGAVDDKNLINVILNMKRASLAAVNQMNMFGAIGKQIVINKQPVNLREFGSTLEEGWQGAFKVRNIDFQLNLPDMKIMVDRLYMGLVWENLIANAFKYTPNEGMFAISFTQKKGRYQFKFKNSGEVVPEKLRSSIFVKYNSSCDTNPYDKGFGLSFSQMIAELHGGNMYYTVEAGRNMFVLEILDI